MKKLKLVLVVVILGLFCGCNTPVDRKIEEVNETKYKTEEVEKSKIKRIETITTSSIFGGKLTILIFEKDTIFVAENYYGISMKVK